MSGPQIHVEVHKDGTIIVAPKYQSYSHSMPRVSPGSVQDELNIAEEIGERWKEAVVRAVLRELLK